MLSGASERRMGGESGQPRATSSFTARLRDDESLPTGQSIEPASTRVRCGWPRITTLPRREAQNLNHELLKRIWRQAGRKVPRNQPRCVAASGSVADWSGSRR